MLCPRCGDVMVLSRIEDRGYEVVYIYKCPRCKHRLEVSYLSKQKLRTATDWNKDYVKRFEVSSNHARKTYTMASYC